MQAMVILKRCRAAENELGRIRLRIRQRRDLLTSTGAPALDPNHVGRSGGDPDKNGRIMAEIDILERELARRQERKAVEEASTLALLDMAPETESKVLFGYYVKRETTAGTARRLHITDGYARKVKRRGEEIMRMLGPDSVAKTLPRWYLEEEGGDGE